MIHYKKAVYIIFIELILVLLMTVVLAWLFYDNAQFEIVSYASILFSIIAFAGGYFLIESQKKIVTFIFTLIVIATVFMGYVLNTMSHQILVFLVTACILTVFLNPKYIIIYGIITFVIQLFVAIFNNSLIFDVMNPYLYSIYLVCYALGIFNIYLLVIKAKHSIERMEEANKSKNSFLAAMAHEIRTPMNAILSLSEKIISEHQSDEIIEHTGKIINAGNILLSMTNSILDYSLIESGKYAINDIIYQSDDLIFEVVEMTKIQLENKEIEFEIIKDVKLPASLYGDQMRIRQIVLNVLSNAVKYTEKGKITLTVCWIEDDSDGRLVFTIKDTGDGIKKADLEKIFQSFTRLGYSRRVEGTGLGLPICRELTIMMGGEITVESTYKEGSTFRLVIPQKIHYKGKTIKAHGAKILVVEDTRANSLLLERLLEAYEVIVETVKDGYECLARIKEEKYDLIFMDYLMPEMDGLETVRMVRNDNDEHYKTVPIIVLSSGDEKIIKNKFLEIGCQDFIEKPIKSESLEEIIINYLPKKLLIIDN